MIKTINLECRYFSPVHLDVWEKELYSLSEDGTVTYNSYSNGDKNTPKAVKTVSLTAEEKEKIFRKVEELSCIDEMIYQTLDDCSGEVTVRYDNGEEITKQRDSQVYDYLIDIFENIFDKQNS